MLAAISAANEGNNVTIVEKMNTLGRKLLITGKGRCNITSSLDMSEFIKNIPGNGMFLYSCFQNFTNLDIIYLMNKNGLGIKIERGNRVFPVTDKSQDVLNVLLNELKRLKVEIMENTKAQEIVTINNKVSGIKVNDNQFIECDKLIIATGGKSYPKTGSTGDGYELVKKLGHTITDIKPSLVPLETYENNICEELQGLSLKNVSIKIMHDEKLIYKDFGEMLFTHFGISGPIILSGSAYLLRYKNIDQLLKQRKVKIIIDLKPALTVEKLDMRIRRDFEENKNKCFKNSLIKLLPHKSIDTIIKCSEINPEKKVNEITKEERKKLVTVLKNFTLTIKCFRDIEEAIITSGGVNIKEINPKTMESKIVKNLYFAGEIIDVDALTGGFNLQIAYSTGYTAGLNN